MCILFCTSSSNVREWICFIIRCPRGNVLDPINSFCMTIGECPLCSKIYNLLWVQGSALKTLQKQRRFLLIFMCIPVSPGRSRLIYVFPRNFAVWVDQVVPRWIFHVGQNLILDSDLYLLHVEVRLLSSLFLPDIFILTNL